MSIYILGPISKFASIISSLSFSYFISISLIYLLLSLLLIYLLLLLESIFSSPFKLEESLLSSLVRLLFNPLSTLIITFLANLSSSLAVEYLDNLTPIVSSRSVATIISALDITILKEARAAR